MTVALAAALNRDQFLAGVRASGVMADRQFDRATEALGPIQKTAGEVADFFVAHDWLTRFQADRLLLGRSDGFHLGPYVVLDYLGKSASARVYKARHRTMNRAVAVHVLKAELTDTEQVREGIRVQARLAARLAHPNVLTLLDVNSAGDRMYTVHEFVDGSDLGATVRANGRLTTAQACLFGRQIAAGLQHAHDKGTAHGRLTPAAVLVGRAGGHGPQDKPVVKVAGLGLAAFAAVEAEAEYAAPDASTGAAADLYSLGAVLHFLLVGRPPKGGVVCGELVVRADVPAGLTAVIAALLSANPARRPASAALVADALDSFADDTAVNVDFNVPSAGPTSAATLSGGWAVGTALMHPPASRPTMPTAASTPPPVPCPFAELNEVGDERSADTLDPAPTDRTPVQTERRRKRRNGPAAPPRKRERESRRLWWGIAAAVAVLIGVVVCVAVLMAVLKG